MFSNLKRVLLIKALYCGFGGEVCTYGRKTCYTEAMECRESAALLRFAVYISELVSCIMSALDFLTLKLLH